MVVWVAVFAALPVLRLSGPWSYSFLIYRNNDKISASSISGAALSAKWYSDTFILFIFFVLSVLSKCPLMKTLLCLLLAGIVPLILNAQAFGGQSELSVSCGYVSMVQAGDAGFGIGGGDGYTETTSPGNFFLPITTILAHV